MSRIVAFDSLRFILAIFIMLHHLEILLYQNIGVKVLYFQTSYLAVEGFFVISGFLLCASYCQNRGNYSTSADYMAGSTISRLKRLYPEMLFVLIISVIMGKLFFGDAKTLSIIFNIFLLSDMGTVSGLSGGWYVPVLFWVGYALLGLMEYQRTKAYIFWIPLLMFVSLATIMNVHGCLAVHTSPLFTPFLEGGILRGILGLGAGILTYKVCQYLQSRPLKFARKKFAVGIILFGLELYAVITLFGMLICHQNSPKDFLVFFYYSFIVGLLYFGREKLLKILNWKPLVKISFLAYMVYLSHQLIIKVIIKWIDYKIYPEWIILTMSCIATIMISYLFYKGTKYSQKLLCDWIG